MLFITAAAPAAAAAVAATVVKTAQRRADMFAPEPPNVTFSCLVFTLQSWQHVKQKSFAKNLVFCRTSNHD